MAFLERNYVIYKYQFGFRKNHNTIQAITEITEEIHRDLDKGKTIMGIYTNLRKAFDSVNHQILKQKLYRYGITGTANKWFHTYLENRKQYVINGVINRTNDK